jgi:hypothetical protein
MSPLSPSRQYDALFSQHRDTIRLLMDGIPTKYIKQRQFGPLQVLLTIAASHFGLATGKGQSWTEALHDVARDFGESLGWKPGQSFTREAFQRARSKLTESDMTALWADLGNLLQSGRHLSSLTQQCGLRFLHVDGSQFFTERSADLIQQFGVQTNGPNANCHYPQGQWVAMIEGGTGALVGTQLVRCKKKDEPAHSDLDMGERSGLAKLLHLQGENDCVVADAGFLSYALMQDMNQKGRYFLMSASRSYGIIKAFKRLRKSEAVITYRLSKIQAGSACRDRDLTVRIVTITSEDGSTKYLITNVMNDLLTRTQVRRVFKQRWSIEVFFRNAKTFLGLRQLRSRTLFGVRQELFVIMLMMRLFAYVQSTVAQLVNRPRQMLDVFLKGFRKPRVHMTLKYVWGLLMDAHVHTAQRLRLSWDTLLKTMQRYLPDRHFARASKSPTAAFKPKRPNKNHRKTKGNEAKGA